MPKGIHTSITVYGKTYPTLKAAAEEFGYCQTTIARRLARGMTPEEAFSVSPDPKYQRPNQSDHFVEDHNHNRFSNREEMAKFHGKSLSVLDARQYTYGMSLEDALTIPVTRRIRPQIGDVYTTRCGLSFKLTKLSRTTKSRAYFWGIFIEDGTEKEVATYTIRNETITHPTLKTSKSIGHFLNFETTYIGQSEDGRVWYKTKNMDTGEKDILTPQMMIEYREKYGRKS